MSSEIIVAACSLVGTAIGSFSGMRLMSYRIEQLEKRVDKHNNVIERVYRLEEADAVRGEQIRVANHRIDDLERRDDK